MVLVVALLPTCPGCSVKKIHHSSAEYLFKRIIPAEQKLPLVVPDSEDQAAEFRRMNDRAMVNIRKAMDDPGGRVCRSLLRLSLITYIF
jgi:hypothetical protein